MDNCFFISSENYEPNKDDNILSSIFKQYEYVIVQSLITSFGLDFFIKDHQGGDVDTIHNVRAGIYQKDSNREKYNNRGIYDSNAYHQDQRYKEKNKSISKAKKMVNYMTHILEIK